MNTLNNKIYGMVVNLHLLDACNFRCVNCFARFGAKKALHFLQWKKIIDNICNDMPVKRFNLGGTLLMEGFSDAFSRLPFDYRNYLKRYGEA